VKSKKRPWPQRPRLVTNRGQSLHLQSNKKYIQTHQTTYLNSSVPPFAGMPTGRLIVSTMLPYTLLGSRNRPKRTSQSKAGSPPSKGDFGANMMPSARAVAQSAEVKAIQPLVWVSQLKRPWKEGGKMGCSGNVWLGTRVGAMLVMYRLGKLGLTGKIR
jgi:hypothetical protein